MADNNALEARVIALEKFATDMQSSNSIPRNVETALRERLKDIAEDSLIFGIGTLSSGRLDISDPRITSQSVGVGIRYGSSTSFSLADAQLASGYVSGITYRFFESTFSEGYQVAYIIIP